MNLLRGAIRHYDWGSRTAIAELTRRPSPSSVPEAELWLGAHPVAPAQLITDDHEESLLAALHTDPKRYLGADVCDQFGPELPFLMKVIAADQPLSLQAHPNSAQARIGFALEEQTGVTASAADRNYRDGRHKPEMVIALSQFEVLAGFRPIVKTRELLRAIGFDDYNSVLNPQEPQESLNALLTVWMSAPSDVVIREVQAVRDGAAAYLRGPEFEFEAECMTLVELSERHPTDSGVLAATLLNRLSLQHGDALYLPAGNLHAYLRGVAIEVMANSDNVLRGGLTSKHVDVGELLSILDFTPITPAELQPSVRGDGPRQIYTPPVDEFVVTVWRFDEGHFGRELSAADLERGPHILLCTEGSLVVHQGCTSLQLNRGDAAWISDHDRSIRLRANRPTTLFAAGVPGCSQP